MRTIILATVVLLPLMGEAQVWWSGQTAADFQKSSPGETQRAINWGRPTMGWQTHLFLDGQVTENAGAMINIRVAADQVVNFDYVAVRITDVSPIHLSLQAGKFDLPFGNLADRRFPRANPLYSLPLPYTYATSLRTYVTSAADILGNRGRGTGMRMLDVGMYDLGVMVFGTWGPLDYAAALSSGTVSTASYSSANVNSDLAKTFRVAMTPLTGLTLGTGYSWGAYLAETDYTPSWVSDVNDYLQKTIEADIDFSRGHAVVSGEALYTVWRVPFRDGDQDLTLFGYSLEGKYTIAPRLFFAIRVGGLQFGTMRTATGKERWDYPVTEWEGGVGYFLAKDVLLKIDRRETRTQGGTHPKDGLTAAQLVVAY